MTMFSVRVPDDLGRRFDMIASKAGGRSALLRRLIATCAQGEPPAPEVMTRHPAAARVMVRLAAPDVLALDREAEVMGLRRATWVAALVRRRLRSRPTFNRSAELAVFAVQKELRRVGVNINQIARALNTAVLEGRVLDLELDEIRALGREMRGHMAAIREAFVGNLAYWDIAP